MDEETRNRLIAETKSAAEALADDLRHVRKVLKDEKKLRGDVRRLAGIARRLLIDRGTGDLTRVALPRTGNPKIRCPNNSVFRDLDKHLPSLSWALSGGAEVATVTAKWALMMKGSFDPKTYPKDTGADVEVSLDEFLNHRVAFDGGVWATRRDVIKFVANIGHSVHSGAVKSAEEQALRRLANDTHVGLQLLEAPSIIELPREKMCDGVNFEMLCALSFVVESPEVQKLEKVIAQELRLI